MPINVNCITPQVIGMDEYGNPSVALPTVQFNYSGAVSATQLTSDSAQVAYIPSMPGTLQLYINLSTASTPAPVQVAPFYPLVSLAPAPRLLAAQLDSSLAIIMLRFDQATNQVQSHAACALHGPRVEYRQMWCRSQEDCNLPLQANPFVTYEKAATRAWHLQHTISMP